MAFVPGTHKLGPENASLKVNTYRQGVASRAGHDLVIEVTRWDATLTLGEDWAEATIELTADPRSLEVREGRHGVKPLSDKDRAEVEKNLDEKVLRQAPISFRSSHLELSDDRHLVEVTGELALAGERRSITFKLSVDPAGDLEGSVALTQSEWGIKPYSALMGALKVRDDVDVVCATRLRSHQGQRSEGGGSRPAQR